MNVVRLWTLLFAVVDAVAALQSAAGFPFEFQSSGLRRNTRMKLKSANSSFPWPVWCMAFLFRPCDAECPQKLAFYQQKVFNQFEVTLNVCCDVDAYYLVRLNDKMVWSLLLPPVYDFTPISKISLPGGEIFVSTCGADNQTFPGYIQSHNGEPCRVRKGDQISLRQTTERKFKMNRWYVQCFRLSRPAGCQVCELKLFCQNIYAEECARVWLQKSIDTVTNTSMNLWVQVGRDLPFPADLKIVVYEQTHRPSSLPVIDHSKSFAGVKTSSQPPVPVLVENVPGGGNSNPEFKDKVRIRLDQLKADTWYRVRTCMVVSPPDWFRKENNLPMPAQLEICAQDESYRTLGGLAFSGACAQSGSTFLVGIILSLFILLRLQLK